MHIYIHIHIYINIYICIYIYIYIYIGTLSDIWMLRLSLDSTTNSTAITKNFVHTNCATRFLSNQFLKTCLGISGASCSLREMLLLAWCSSNNQTMS